MANITKTKPKRSQDYAGVVMIWTAATTTDQEAEFGPRDVLVAKNTGGSARTITVYSAPDATGRTRDISQSIAAGATIVFPKFPRDGWQQSNGTLRFKATNAEVFFSVLADA